ncbi:MAG: MATE family efflux transporter [Oscillospiraceae bacterium]|nr:MATE family efflux transporter [Oscillospiraceae bacterium]
MSKEIDWSLYLHPDAAPGPLQQMALVLRLSIPAILAEISSIAMQYIDAAMVGSLGANATAAIGLVASTTWLFSGVCVSAAAGFSVQIAQLIGAGRREEAQSVVRQGLMAAVAIGLLMGALGAAISSGLPRWLHGAADVCPNASRYFLIYSCALPFSLLRQAAGSMLQCSGDMRTPSILNILLCALDVAFNGLLIFPARAVSVLGVVFALPGAGLGVAGAALGTALSEVVTAAGMVLFLCFRSPILRLVKGVPWRMEQKCLRTAARLALPMAAERIVLGGAHVAATRIVAPLGTVAVAADSLAVTVEGFCYMPGYGIASAATTLVGQSIGAGRKDLSRRFAYLSVALGMGIMAFTGVLMFLMAPWMFSLLTPDPAIQELGSYVLRIEAFAEPLFAASIVVAGALRGAGDTLAPSVLNLVSMWGVRITAAMVLAPRFGLPGVWAAMCGELCIRGILFLIRLVRGKWLEGRRAAIAAQR